VYIGQTIQYKHQNYNKRKQLSESKLHHFKVKMMNNQAVRELTVTLLNKLSNMLKAVIVSDGYTMFSSRHIKDLLALIH